MKTTKTIHFGIQRKIVANMTSESWKTIPHVSGIYEADVTKITEVFSKLRSSGKLQNRLTLNTLMLKVIVEGIKAAPVLNSHINFNERLVRGRIDTFEDINISMPMTLPNGEMMTINLHNFENKTLDEMSEYLLDVQRRLEKTNLTEAMFEVSLDNTMTALKQGKIIKTVGRLIGSKTGKHKVKTLGGSEKKAYLSIPESERITKRDIEQGTITISNWGSIDRSLNNYCTMLEIIPPQVAVIAINAAVEKPVVVTGESGEKEIAIRKIMPISFAFDHRACEYGDIVPFLRKIEAIFENPEQILEW